MAKKEIKAIVKLQIPAGKANPAPPVGSALGQHGVAIMNFCKEFNAKTKELGNDIIPVVITVHQDRSFTFMIKTPPTASLILKALGKEKGSGLPNKEKIGNLNRKQIEEIAKKKLPDLNTTDLEAAIRVVLGTAKNMGVEVAL